MTVSTEIVIEKMRKELEKAKIATAEQKDWKLSIAHVKLLAELLLEEQSSENVATAKNVTPTSKLEVKQEKNHDDGTSIFDF